MLRRDYIGIEPPTFQQVENAATHTVINMLMVVVVALTDQVFDKRQRGRSSAPILVSYCSPLKSIVIVLWS